jgi:type II secretory pathway component PulF
MFLRSSSSEAFDQKITPNSSINTMNITPVLQEVNMIRRRENFSNALKFFAVLFLVWILGSIAIALADSGRGLDVISSLVGLIFFIVIGCIFNFIYALFPFFLYWWGNVQTLRQRTLLSLIQTAVAMNTPMQDIIRTYAATCFSWYAVRLERFAAALDSGKSLEEAIRENNGLLRYDVAGIVRLGGNDPETIRSLESLAMDERDFSVIKTHTLVRIVYLCTVVCYMMLVMTFVFIKIVPNFEKIFRDFDTNLPTMTSFIIGVSNFCLYYWYLGTPFIMLISLALIIYLILQTACLVVRPFGFRRMFRSTDSAKFLLVFAAGIRRRFPIPIILRMYNWTVPSEYLRRKGMKIRTAVENGGDWIDAVRRSGFVNAPEASLIRSAQRTGNTAAVLDQLAHSKERLQMRKDDLLSKMVFVPLIFLLGAVVGAFVIGMFLPLITLIMALT